MRALPAYARSYRLIRAWTDEGAALCSLAQQTFGVICVVTPGSAGGRRMVALASPLEVRFSAGLTVW